MGPFQPNIEGLSVHKHLTSHAVLILVPPQFLTARLTIDITTRPNPLLPISYNDHRLTKQSVLALDG
jgi:hypothetical protein